MSDITTKEEALETIERVIESCDTWRDWGHDRHNFESMSIDLELVKTYIENK